MTKKNKSDDGKSLVFLGPEKACVSQGKPGIFLTDKIHINSLGLWMALGINDAERAEKQALSVDVTLECDLRKAGLSDKLADTIDYRDVCATIRAIGERTFSTVEGLAETIATTAKQKYPLTAITVHIKKPGALVRGAKFAAIEITR